MLGPLHAVDRVKQLVRKAAEWTSPRPATAGNLPKPSYFQAAFNGASDGFYVLGPVGALTGGGSAAIGVAARILTHSRALGVAAGAASGAALGGLVGGPLGGPLGLTAGAAVGALLGAYETFRGEPDARTRDSGNGSLIAALLISGPAKMAAGFGSMVGATMENPWQKLAVSVATGATVGAVIAALTAGPAGVVTAAVASGVAAGAGPFLGPRFSQLFRNVAGAVGNQVHKLGRKLGWHEHGSKRGFLALGAIPAAFLKEAVRGFMYSDGAWEAVVVGGVKESIRQAHIMLKSNEEPACKHHRSQRSSEPGPPWTPSSTSSPTPSPSTAS